MQNYAKFPLFWWMHRRFVSNLPRNAYLFLVKKKHDIVILLNRYWKKGQKSNGLMV